MRLKNVEYITCNQALFFFGEVRNSRTVALAFQRKREKKDRLVIDY